MGTQTTILDNVESGYDVYILEVIRGPDMPYYSDEITETLNDNFEQAAKSLGENGVIIRPIKRKARGQAVEFLSRMDISPDNQELPKLIITEQPPLKMKSGDKCIVFHLSHMNNSTEVSELLKNIHVCVQDDEFMKELTIEEKKRNIERKMENVSGPLGLVISLASLL